MNHPYRKNLRLPDYDYSSPGYYFVTTCVQSRICLFGNVGAESPGPVMHLNAFGHMVHRAWNGIPDHFPNVEVDEFIVMPNHVHGIIILTGAGRPRPHPTLGQTVAFFKYESAKQINMIRKTPGLSVWQRNYYERVIRNERELAEIRHYIHYNPHTWDYDEENPLTRKGGRTPPLPS